MHEQPPGHASEEGDLYSLALLVYFILSSGKSVPDTTKGPVAVLPDLDRIEEGIPGTADLISAWLHAEPSKRVPLSAALDLRDKNTRYLLLDQEQDADRIIRVYCKFSKLVMILSEGEEALGSLCSPGDAIESLPQVLQQPLADARTIITFLRNMPQIDWGETLSPAVVTSWQDNLMRLQGVKFDTTDPLHLFQALRHFVRHPSQFKCDEYVPLGMVNTHGAPDYPGLLSYLRDRYPQLFFTVFVIMQHPERGAAKYDVQPGFPSLREWCAWFEVGFVQRGGGCVIV